MKTIKLKLQHSDFNETLIYFKIFNNWHYIQISDTFKGSIISFGIYFYIKTKVLGLDCLGYTILLNLFEKLDLNISQTKEQANLLERSDFNMR